MGMLEEEKDGPIRVSVNGCLEDDSLPSPGTVWAEEPISMLQYSVKSFTAAAF